MISLIVAIAQNNVIGGDNKLLWHISDDLKRFKKITSGNTIVMGRKTFESLPRVLPNRKHIILTRDKNYTVDNPSVEVIHNINDIINNFKNSPVEVFIIGGGEIYNQFINSVDKIYLTKVFKNFEGDTTFPEIDYNNWNITFESEIFTDEKSNINYQFINLEK
ncbi:dihydrofolate reductase [Clostridium disporicum]|jgi:dihydrofolate reductase|uniref:Dihydrofolate reductase n=1 Tax=Clostridium disporicum TaxID=84024 RepID=A0A174HVC6_9CLOT|nr:dihydrofolate reductase [Clostridium disporicum]CUO78932.1 dihydrofolate reductase [Clostridium disporicum]